MDAIMLHETDNVATALRDLAAGEEFVVGIQERTVRVRVGQPIAFGHKLAVCVQDVGWTSGERKPHLSGASDVPAAGPVPGCIRRDGGP